MRLLLAATLTASALLLAGTAPSSAREYSWCSRTPSNAGNNECNFTSFQQCQATVSGQGGDCILNPRLAFGQTRGSQGRY